MLTSKQRELLLFIHQRIKESGVSPSFDEMKEALDLASKSGIHRLITALEERGFLRRLPHKARALEVLKMPEAAAPAAPPRGKAGKLAVVGGAGGWSPAHARKNVLTLVTASATHWKRTRSGVRGVASSRIRCKRAVGPARSTMQIAAGSR